MSYMFGVDVGGTFTDLSVFDTKMKMIFNYKLSSTPRDPSNAIVEGITEVMNLLNLTPEEISYLAHGTTVATNALIEKKGSRVGLITTEGFKDLLEIGWQKRPNLYDLLRPKAESILPHGHKYEVTERILYDGSIKKPLDEDSVLNVIECLKKQHTESVAICTLFSFINPVHEKRIKELVQKHFPEAYVTASHELVNEFREYSRMSTTVLNAYLGAVMKKYVQNFEQSIKKIGIKAKPYVTQSNGSIISISETIDCPIKTAVSGPSAGVVGAAYLGKLCGVKNIITFDMGGTSADISLISDGKPKLSAERLIEGHPARIPMIDIITIGAGGGSIAHIDEGGALKVGPESAGARPGPACYNYGGLLPTVTDANIYLGKLNQEKILGGRMNVCLDLAKESIKQEICDKSTLNMKEAATGIISVVNSNMMRAIRVVSVERGYDVREFVLMAFGGAGPLHACEVAQEIGISKVIIPPAPGTLCSLGLLMADTKFDLSRSNIMLAKPENLTAINDIFNQMINDGNALLDKECIAGDKRSFTLSVDARYERQNYEINIPLSDYRITEALLQNILDDFHLAHEKNYGYLNRDFNVQFVNYRISAIGEIEKPNLEAEAINIDFVLPKPIEYRSVLFNGEKDFRKTPVYNRDTLVPGCKAQGPMVIEQMDTTTIIPPHWKIIIDPYHNIHTSYDLGEITKQVDYKTDSVTVEIVGNLMLSIAEETCLSIIKSAYSTNIKERRDVSSAVLDPDGELIAQADYLPMHLNAFLTFVPYIYSKYPRESILPGDMFIGNDPYNGGGNHLPDIVVAEPVFGNNNIIGWIINMAHHSDIGGMVPGSTSSYASSIFQEGIRIPVIRILREGKLEDGVMQLLLGNTRTRTERLGDLTAQISSNHVGARRMREAYSKYGDNLITSMDELKNYAERRLRTAISEIPDGMYSYTDYVDDGGENHPEPLEIAVNIKIQGDSIDFDFSRTCKQIKSPLNISYNTLLAACFYSLKVLFGSDIPANYGIFRVFSVKCSKGSLVNPTEPAPLGLTVNSAQRLPDVIFGALADVAKERVLAGCNSTCQTTVFSCDDPVNPGNSIICHEAIAGGSGASMHADGLSAVQVHMTNTSNMPIEALETEFPIVSIKKYGLRCDSGGAGEFRGGLGIHREFEIMREGISCKATGDRQKYAPYGLAGGMDGETGAFYHRSNGIDTKMPSKSTGNIMKKGDILIAMTPGAGGYGNPLERPAMKVFNDVLDDYVSIEKAFEYYGVVIIRNFDGTLDLDIKATEKCRKSRILKQIE